MNWYNAALRGECRINQLSADHFQHQKPPHTKNATRHESHLNALLYLGLIAEVTRNFEVKQHILKHWT